MTIIIADVNMTCDSYSKGSLSLLAGFTFFTLTALAGAAVAASETATPSGDLGTQKTVALIGAAVIILIDILLVVTYWLRKKQQKM
ncbi:MAG TPA: hypothetical protein VI934_03610 [Candidatus Nanoarchaeia archaeon]|nr:hypothetical protein [Candidatus Nanoarchaeia archaeon]